MRQILRYIMVLSLLGCTRSNEINVTTVRGEHLKLAPNETLRINLSTEPPTLDWQLSADTTSSLILVNLMDGLVGYDLAASRDTMKLAPALALKWESSDHARIWKFTLRQDVKWSDGVAFTPQHAIDGMKRLLMKETASEYASFLYGVKNGKAFSEGRKPWVDVGIKQTGAFEITIELEKPMGYFPSLLAHPSAYPVRLDVIAKAGGLWTQPENIVTLGPYRLRVWQHDNLLVMERNETYYGAKPLVKNVAAYMLTEATTAMNLFDSGRIDSIHRPPSIDIKNWRPRKEHREASTLLTGYYGFNMKKAPFDNLLVRKAVNMAIDRQEVVKMLGGGQIPLPCWLVPGVVGYDEKIGLGFDPVKARALLKEAGFDGGRGFPKTDIRFNTNEDNRRIAENIQAQIKRNLGISIEIKEVEWKVYLSELKLDPPPIFRFGWAADYPDADNFMTVLSSYSENNHVFYKSAEYDALVEKAGSAVDESERRRLYVQAQQLLCEKDVPIIPLYISRNHLLVSDRVENYPINVMERYEFKGVRLK